jgi:hypothetical protein
MKATGLATPVCETGVLRVASGASSETEPLAGSPKSCVAGSPCAGGTPPRGSGAPTRRVPSMEASPRASPRPEVGSLDTHRSWRDPRWLSGGQWPNAEERCQIRVANGREVNHPWIDATRPVVAQFGRSLW